MQVDREAIIIAAAEIARLREELKAKEAELDRLLAPAPNLLTLARPESEDKTLNQRIIDLIASSPTRRFSAEDILAVMPDANITSIRSALPRLADQGRIVRADRGLYEAAFKPVAGTDTTSPLIEFATKALES